MTILNEVIKGKKLQKKKNFENKIKLLILKNRYVKK